MLEGRILRGRYRVGRLLGRGGMAEVYLAFDTRRQVSVALKLLREDLAEDPEFVRRFEREAEALARLDHPYIVRFYSFEREGRAAFIVMDYVPGISLRGRLMEAGGPLPLEEVTRIVRQVGTALAYAHNEGFVHRDIKPGNIMLREDGTSLLSDFGIARAAETTTMITIAPLGTPSYMSPEQILGHEADPRTDVYCLGVVLYEMVTGRRPFLGDVGTGRSTAERVRNEHLYVAPPDPRSINGALPPAVSAVILKALAKRPEERWQDVMSLVRAWERALDLEHQAMIGVSTQLPSDERVGTPLPIQNDVVDGPQSVRGRSLSRLFRERSTWMTWVIGLVAALALGGALVCAAAGLGVLTLDGTGRGTATIVASANTVASTMAPVSTPMPDPSLTRQPSPGLTVEASGAQRSGTATSLALLPTRVERGSLARQDGGSLRSAEGILRVKSDRAWADEEGNISIVGEVVNDSSEVIDTMVVVVAELRDENGNAVEGDFRSYLDRPVIPPGERSSFWILVRPSDLEVDSRSVAEYDLSLWITDMPSPDVELVVDWAEASEEDGGLYIRGKVSNQTSLEFVLLSVYSSLYESNGNLINATVDNIELDSPLGPNEQTEFTGYFLDHYAGAEQFYVIVTGWTKEALE